MPEAGYWTFAWERVDVAGSTVKRSTSSATGAAPELCRVVDDVADLGAPSGAAANVSDLSILLKKSAADAVWC
jgi:hypothetical protein